MPDCPAQNKTLLKEVDVEKRDRILEKIRTMSLSEEEIGTIREVISNKALFRRLCEEPNASARIEQFLNDSENGTHGFRQFCMGAWLAMANEAAMDDEGVLLVRVENGELRFSGVMQHQRSMLLRQAATRQIERWAVFRANGIRPGIDVSDILDIGGGTLLGSVMAREMFPRAEIVAVEPGLVTKRAQSIAGRKGISLSEKLPDKRRLFDVILLHFVLEHDEQQAKDLIRQAVWRLKPNGRISIAVPNFSAFHRVVETKARVNGRDPHSRLSLHDVLSGHQIIFTEAKLSELVRQVLAEKGTNLPVHACTILPRPLSFNLMCAIQQQGALYELERAGHVPDLANQGSVICISVGNEAIQYPTPINQDDETLRMFRKLIGDQSGSTTEIRRRVREAAIELYPQLFKKL